MIFDPAATIKDRIAGLKEHVKSLGRDDRPILVGPWRSELGFEATYWSPFVAWLSKQVPKFKQRAFVVTRGGLAPLYGTHTAGGVDLYSLRTVRDVRRENLYDQRATGLQKQTASTEWDARVLNDAADSLRIGHAYHVLHPAWMYWALAPFWDGLAGTQHVQSMTDFAKLPAINIDGLALPERFIAMRFYGRATFPYPHPETERFVAQIVAGVAQHMPIVLLNSPVSHDDHTDIRIEGDGITRLPDDLRDDQHLAVHAAVLSKAAAFIGTYGGVAQLALRLGVPSVSFYHQWGGTSHMHLMLNDLVAKTQGVPFLVSSTADAVLWKQITTGLVIPVVRPMLVPA